MDGQCYICNFPCPMLRDTSAPSVWTSLMVYLLTAGRWIWWIILGGAVVSALYMSYGPLTVAIGCSMAVIGRWLIDYWRSRSSW